MDGNEQEPGEIHRVLGCDVATLRSRQYNQPWEAGADGPVGAGLALVAEEEEIDETRQTLNVNPTVKVGIIVC